MPVDYLSSFSDVPLDTPPLSPSRSPSSASATRSSGSSSNSSISLGEFTSLMSKSRFDRPISHDSTKNVDAHVLSRKFVHDDVVFNGTRERDIQEENDDDMVQDGHEDRGRSGRSGHDGRITQYPPTPHSRPSIPRLGSYSKRHSSFDTPREVPFPSGYLSPVPSSSQAPCGGPHPECPKMDSLVEHKSEGQTSTGLDSSKNSTTNESSDSHPLHRGHSSTSLPLPCSIPYSSLPPLSSPRYENPRPAPMIPKSHFNSLEQGIQTSVASPPSSSLRPPIMKTETSSNSPHFRFLGPSPSPPLLADENDANEATSSHSRPAFDSRTHNSLPPPQKSPSLPFLSSPRPTSFPHAFTSRSHAGIPSPPHPPTILTPPPPEEEGARNRAPHEPFLPSRQPPADHTYIAVETVPSEYRIIVRLPGFQRDSITLAMRRRRILHIVADNWSDGGGHFERRIAFGYDADIPSVRAEFDGEILRIVIPRRMLPTLYAQAAT